MRLWIAIAAGASTGCSLLFQPSAANSERDAAAQGDDGGREGDGAPGGDGGGGADSAGPFIPVCPPQNIVAHWDFEGDLSTTIPDVQDGLHDGVVVGDPPHAIAGLFGQAADFDHPNRLGFVKVDDSDALDLPEGSIEVWVRYDTNNPTQVVSREASGNGEGHFRMRRQSDGDIEVRLQNPAESMMLEGSAVTTGEWVQIVVNFGCASGCLAELYVSGEKQAETLETFSFAAAQNPFVFGAWTQNAPEGDGTGTPGEYLEGAIDEIVLCDTRAAP